MAIYWCVKTCDKLINIIGHLVILLRLSDNMCNKSCSEMQAMATARDILFFSPQNYEKSHCSVYIRLLIRAQAH